MGADSFNQEFGRAMEEYGFASVVRHGLDQRILAEAFNCAVQAFALPDEVKRKYETPENGRQTGYTSFGIEHAKDDPRPDLKEFWHVYHETHRVKTPFPDEVQESRVWWPMLWDELNLIAYKMCGALGAYLRPADPNYLARMTEKGNSLLRILHYPEVPADTEGMRSAAHEDINLITLLVAATKPGLEVRTRQGEWIPVNNPPEAIVVNAGDMLDLHTFGRMKSATHRVANPQDPDGSRYSIPFFCHPRGEVPLVTAGAYLEHRLREIGLL